MRVIDRTGQRYGRLVAIERAENPRRAAWRCRCDCGAEVIVVGDSLTSGNTRSCGCLRSDTISALKSRHGKSETRAHDTWVNMRARCARTVGPEWEKYGSRGIKVCERWSSFESFFEDMGDPPDDMSIDRINNDGDYEPGNCRWATGTQQNLNRRNTVFIDHAGERTTLGELVERSGIPKSTLRRHIAKYGADAALSGVHRRNINHVKES